MAEKKMKLTKRSVDALVPVPGKQFLVWDDELANFGICVSNRGAGPPTLTYFYYYRDSIGRGHRPTIGKHGRLTADEARQIARKQLLAVSQGADPIADKKAERQEILFEDFAKRYMDEWSRKKKKPSTVRTDESLLRNHVGPFFKGRKLSSITREDVRRLRHKLNGTPSQANRAVALVSHMFTWAENEAGLRPPYTNPCHGIKDYPEKKRDRYLRPAEVRKLGEVLTKYEISQPEAVRAIRLFLFTGMRMNEVLGLSWSMIDFERGEVNVQESKSGAKTVILPEPALDLLRTVPRSGPWVVPSPRNPANHMVNVNKTWHTIRREAGIADVWIHDLRRTYGSVGVQAGAPMETIQGLLVHKDLRTTQQHYAHMANAPLHQAADRIGGLIAEELAGGTGRDGVRILPNEPGSKDAPEPSEEVPEGLAATTGEEEEP